MCIKYKEHFFLFAVQNYAPPSKFCTLLIVMGGTACSSRPLKRYALMYEYMYLECENVNEKFIKFLANWSNLINLNVWKMHKRYMQKNIISRRKSCWNIRNLGFEMKTSHIIVHLSFFRGSYTSSEMELSADDDLCEYTAEICAALNPPAIFDKINCACLHPRKKTSNKLHCYF